MASHPGRKQINIWFTNAAYEHIGTLAKAVGKRKGTYIRDIMIDVLRDDALANGESIPAKIVAKIAAE